MPEGRREEAGTMPEIPERRSWEGLHVPVRTMVKPTDEGDAAPTPTIMATPTTMATSPRTRTVSPRRGDGLPREQPANAITGLDDVPVGEDNENYGYGGGGGENEGDENNGSDQFPRNSGKRTKFRWQGSKISLAIAVATH